MLALGHMAMITKAAFRALYKESSVVSTLFTNYNMCNNVYYMLEAASSWVDVAAPC